MRRVLSLHDFEPAAQRHLPRFLFGYVSGAVEEGLSHQANRQAFAAVGFVPRALRDVGRRSQARELFGQTYAHPFGICPMGFSAVAANDGDVVLTRTAAEIGMPAICSGSSLTPLERIAGEGRGRWFQAYLPGDDAHIVPLVERVAAAGFETLVLTVDVPVSANRENNIRNGFDAPFRPGLSLAWQCALRPRWFAGTWLDTLRRRGMPHFENMAVTRGPPIVPRARVRPWGGRDRVTWAHVGLIRRHWPGRFVLKGILSPDDAAIAAAEGVDGLIVSNHGGRQLDGAVSPLGQLAAIRERALDMTLMLDSGVRRGTDVLKALAMGAQFVFIGRPFLFAAAIAGPAGVRHAAQLLGAEIDRDMAMLGIDRLAQLTPELLGPLR
ncbi:MAG: alpha-hydroxy acid oxidase [Burkholderiaceae bacterium]